MSNEAKIIFLDIDGVLASARNDAVRNQLNQAWSEFDPVAVQMINVLCANYGAKIVITSSWADDYAAKEDLEDYFRKAGFTGHFHDDWRIDEVGDVRNRRGVSIFSWCEAHNLNPEQCIIIDDNVFDLPKAFLPRFVKTDAANGMNLAAFVRAQILLGKEKGKGDDALMQGAAHPSLNGQVRQ